MRITVLASLKIFSYGLEETILETENVLIKAV